MGVTQPLVVSLEAHEDQKSSLLPFSSSSGSSTFSSLLLRLTKLSIPDSKSSRSIRRFSYSTLPPGEKDLRRDAMAYFVKQPTTGASTYYLRLLTSAYFDLVTMCVSFYLRRLSTPIIIVKNDLRSL